MASHTHKIFRISLFLKGIYSLFELILGIILLIISSEKIASFIAAIFKHELIEDPSDVIATTLINFFNHFSPSLKLFIALYLIIHGAIKVGLVSGLWLQKLKAYPIAIAIFFLFIAYQVYKYILSPSIALIILTILDILVIILTYIEYRHYKKYGKFD